VLTAADGAANDGFGSEVALSGDGNTALIGALGKTVGRNASEGAAYVFTRNGGTWRQQGSVLTAADGAANDGFGWSVALTAAKGAAHGEFGSSVALSGDGNTVLIGAQLTGAAYVFMRRGATWRQQGDGVPLANRALFGHVALSSDGGTILMGAPFTVVGHGQGAAYVLTRSGTSRTH
jgi:hypothetical protein